MSPHADFERDAIALAALNPDLKPAPELANAYGMMCAGVCLGPGYPEQMVAVCDPFRQPQPGDPVIVWVKAPQGFVQVITADRRDVFVAHEAELETDDDLRAIVAEPGVTVYRPYALAFGKLLLKPLPPVAEWAADRSGGLVVQQLEPQLEIRTDLADVLAVDLALEFADLTGAVARSLPMPVASPWPSDSVRWSADQWAWGEEGAPDEGVAACDTYPLRPRPDARPVVALPAARRDAGGALRGGDRDRARRCGEMLRESAQRGERATRQQHAGSMSDDATCPPTLSDLGLTRDQSSRYP